MASQLGTQTQAERENTYAQAGNLESLVLTNFMCHANLEIKLCPGVNFVVGENGSGKSAILTGICFTLVRCARRACAAWRAGACAPPTPRRGR